MRNKITILYGWECPKIKGKIPEPLAEALRESAKDRIIEMMKEGYASGQLQDNVNIDIPKRKTPQDGWECNGWWDVKEEAVEVQNNT
jgi:hypothetical protein